MNRTETLFIEAKSLERDLADRKWISQNLSYATVVGVRWCVLTNGDEYRIYNSHAPVDVEQKLFRSVKISDTSNSAADTLILLSKDQMQGRLLDELWKAHFIDDNVRRSIELMLANEDSGLIRLVCAKTKGVTRSEVRALLKRAKIRIDFPTPPAVGNAPAVQKRSSAAPIETAAAPGIDALIQAGLIRPPLGLERAYKSVHLTATVCTDGSIEFDGQQYESPSTAAGMARKSVIGTPTGQPFPQTNGWDFWMFSDDAGTLHKIDHLRQKFIAQKKILKIVSMG